MEKEYTHGKMVECIKESILMIENMVLEHTHGQMGDNMLDTGRMENNMEKAAIDKQLDKKKEESGKMVKELSGQNDYKISNSNYFCEIKYIYQNI